MTLAGARRIRQLSPTSLANQRFPARTGSSQTWDKGKVTSATKRLSTGGREPFGFRSSRSPSSYIALQVPWWRLTAQKGFKLLPVIEE